MTAEEGFADDAFTSKHQIVPIYLVATCRRLFFTVTINPFYTIKIRHFIITIQTV
jgi:hypothetical protein